MIDSNLQLKPFVYGSEWLRADFHLHTRADKEFQYTNAVEENSFVKDYIQALKEAGIQIGVISNHNKFDCREFKALKKKAKKENIFLLAGVELSVNDGANGIHTLVIFSDAWLENGNDYINQFLNVTFSGKVPSEYEQENGRSNDSLIETIKKLESYHKDFFLIFAHVENRSGLWEELDGGRLEELAQNPYFRRHCLGFQKVITHDKPDKKCRIKIQQWFKDWYPSEVEGCDCKSIENIGNGKTCYLKIGNFSFSAVKQALMDYQHRVTKEKFSYTHSYIKSISFDGGVLDGQTIYFSPELNTLIGIRGSGKSFILEALRYGLNISLGEKAGDVDYKEKLLIALLGNSGKISIQAVSRFGQTYEIHRILNQFPDVYQNGCLQAGVSISEVILNKPIYFGQKDLSNTGDGFEKDLVEKIIGDKLNDIRLQIAQQQQVVKEAMQRFQKLDNLQEKQQEWLAKKQNAEHQLRLYQDYGIEDKLQRQLDFDVDSQKLLTIRSSLNSFFPEIEALINRHYFDLDSQKSYLSKQNQEFFSDFFKTYNEFLSFLKQIQQNLGNGKILFSSLIAKIQEFDILKNNLKEEFAEVERTISTELRQQGINEHIDLQQFHNLKRMISQSIQILQEIDKEQKNKEKLRDSMTIELDELNKLWEQEFNLIEEELNKINNNHSSLEIAAKYQGDKRYFKMIMQDTFRGSRIRETNYQDWVNKYADFGDMHKDIDNIKNSLNNSDAFMSLFRENLGLLLTTQIPNNFIINYQNKELKHHSLGQRASALILFILSQQENDVIIIDQPEDDLDNQTIYQDVIKLIREIKPKTQFIFATHNANFPVLGDSEQILACQYNQQKIEFKSGSIDSPELQKEIVAIMEGGEEAFNKRRDIYQQWKS